MNNPIASKNLFEGVNNYCIQLQRASSTPCRPSGSMNARSINLVEQVLFYHDVEQSLCKPSVWNTVADLHLVIKQQIKDNKVSEDCFEKFHTINKEILNDFKETRQMLQTSIKQAYWWNIIFRTTFFVSIVGFCHFFSHSTMLFSSSMNFGKMVALGLGSICCLTGAISLKKNKLLSSSLQKKIIFEDIIKAHDWENIKCKVRNSCYLAAFIYKTGFLDLARSNDPNVSGFNTVVQITKTLANDYQFAPKIKKASNNT